MGNRAIAATNPLLTNYASGLAQDMRSALANFIAPLVRVPASLGRYKAFDSKNAFLIYDTERALGGAATRITFKASDPTYDCRPQALEVALDDAEYEAAGAGNENRLDENRVSTLVSSSTLAHENKVITAAKTVTAEAGKGVWSDSNVDPVKELDEQIEALATATGMMPNRLVFGIGAWRVFRQHPKVIARFPGAALIGVTEQQGAALLLNPGIQIRIGVLGKDTTKFGGTKSATNLVGSDVFLFIAQESPSEYDPSFMKTFIGGSGGIDAVRTYRDESARSTVHAVDWSEDIVITGSSCVKRVTVS